MAEDKIAVEIEVKGSEESIQSMKDFKAAIKAAKDEQLKAAAAFGEGSDEFVKASKKVSALKDKMDDLNDSTKSLKGSGIERASEGFNQLGEGLRNLDFDKVKVGLVAMKSALAAVGIGLIVQAVMYLVENFDSLSKGSGVLAKVLRGVGDVITTITDYIYKFTDAIGLTNSELDKMGESVVENANKAKEALASQTAEYDRQIAVAKASGKSAVDLEIAKQQAIIETNKALVEQTIAYVRNGGVLDEEQKKLLTGQLEAIKNAVTQQQVITLNAQKERDDKAKAASEKAKAEADKRAAEEKARKDAQLADDLKYMQQIEDAKLQSIQNEEQRASIKAALDKQKRDAEIENSKASEAVKQQALLASEQTFQNEMQKIYDAKKAKDKANEDAAIAAKKAQREQELNDEVLKAELKVTQNQGDLQAELDLLLAKKNLAVEQANGKENEIALIEAKYRQDKKAAEDADREEKRLKEEEERNRNFEAAKGALNSLQSLSDAYFAVKSANTKKGSAEELKQAKKQFDINKGIAIASATISGIQGVVNALSAQSVIPEPFGAILKGVTAVAVGAAAVANISKIASQKFDAGGGGGGSASAVASVAVPAPPTINIPSANTNSSTSFDETGKKVGEDTKTTTPTIKVESTVSVTEINDKQDRVKALETQSTF